MNPVDWTGTRFGRLLAIKRKRRNSGANGTYYRCLCDCGQKTWVLACNLVGRVTRSCGCLRVETSKRRKQTDEHIRLSQIIGYYKRNATVRKLIWKLSRNEVEELTFMKPCTYCGTLGSLGSGFNGMDRLNVNKGYTKSNVVTCCRQCNQARMNQTVDQFLSWVERVYTYQKGAPA
jgi:hypothetical protein